MAVFVVTRFNPVIRGLYSRLWLWEKQKGEKWDESYHQIAP